MREQFEVHVSTSILQQDKTRRLASPAVLTAAFLAVCAFLLYTRVFAVPFVPIRLPGDHMVYVEDAMRMLDGEVLYRDFFNFTLSGTQRMYLTAYQLLGVRTWIPNALVILIGLTHAWLTLRVGRKLLDGFWVFMPALMFTTIAVVPYASPTHHAMSALAVMAAVAINVERPKTLGTIIATAALCALSMWFSQVRGAFAAVGFGVFYLWDHDREEGIAALVRTIAVFSTTFLLSLGALVAYDLYKAGAGAIYYAIFEYVAKYGDKLRWNQFGVISSWEEYPLATWREVLKFSPEWGMHLLMPAVYFVGVYRAFNWWRSGTERRIARDVLLICTMGLASYASIVRSPTHVRMAPDSGLAFLVLIWLLSHEGRVLRAAAIAVCTLGLLYALKIDAGRAPYRLNMPGGPVAFHDTSSYNLLRTLAPLVKPGDYFLDAGSYGNHFYLHARNPAPVPVLSDSDFSRPEQVAATVDNMRKHATNVVVWHVDELEGHGEGGGDNLGPLRDYIRQNYVLRRGADEYQVWERKGWTPTSLSIN